MRDKHIILVGFMGAGKTTIGRRLSYIVRKPFLDMDRYIEKIEGKEIKEIFTEKGEEAFRNIETKAIMKVEEEQRKYVLSTGGGLPVREENRTLLKRMGTIIFLRVRTETIVERLKHDEKRPLLQVENPEERIREMLTLRNPIYEEISDLIIDVDDKSFKDILSEIKLELKKDGETN